MHEVNSPDGTPIACHISGHGSPLVLVHGTSASSARWTPVLPALAEHFRVYAVDRRGRGDSGDAEAYAIEREIEDVVAVVEAIGEPACVLGHSYGAMCALEGALAVRNLDRLVLYEPPLPLSGGIYPDGFVDRLQALLDAGDREGVVSTFMRGIVRMPEHEFAKLKASPAWPARLAAAHTLPRELRAHERYKFEAQRFRKLATPTLLLLGGDSPPLFKTAIDALSATLPNSRVTIMPGQQHIAMDTAPDVFVREVLSFLLETKA